MYRVSVLTPRLPTVSSYIQSDKSHWTLVGSSLTHGPKWTDQLAQSKSSHFQRASQAYSYLRAPTSATPSLGGSHCLKVFGKISALQQGPSSPSSMRQNQMPWPGCSVPFSIETDVLWSSHSMVQCLFLLLRCRLHGTWRCWCGSHLYPQCPERCWHLVLHISMDTGKYWFKEGQFKWLESRQVTISLGKCEWGLRRISGEGTDS